MSLGRRCPLDPSPYVESESADRRSDCQDGLVFFPIGAQYPPRMVNCAPRLEQMLDVGFDAGDRD